jgi:hypothetical protein
MILFDLGRESPDVCEDWETFEGFARRPFLPPSHNHDAGSPQSGRFPVAARVEPSRL